MPEDSRAGRSARGDQILDAAARVFAEHGYAATSVRDLEIATGLARGELFLEYPGKRDLYLATVQHVYAERLVPTVARAINESSQAAEIPLRMLRALRTWHGAYTAALPLFRQTDQAKSREPDVAELDRAMNDAMNSLVAAVLATQQQRGVVAAALDPVGLARVLHLLMDAVYADGAELDDAAAETLAAPLFDVLSQGMAPRNSAHDA